MDYYGIGMLLKILINISVRLHTTILCLSVLKHGVYEDEYRCEVCEVFLSGVVPLREHLVSHKHRKRIKPHLPERNKEVQVKMKIIITFTCEFFVKICVNFV